MWTSTKFKQPRVALALLVLPISIGCTDDKPASARAMGIDPTESRTASTIGPATSAVEPTLDDGWCGGHGVPESVCTRCNDSLIERFKEAGDWCDEHGLPESQCTVCYPEVEAEWAKLNPAANTETHYDDTGSATPNPGKSEHGAVPVGDWCVEHGVPESVCTRCDPSLITRFKEAGDWCAGHGLPESQCTICNPEVREKWAALRPKAVSAGGDGATNVLVERAPRLLTGGTDPLCQVDTLRVRFIDPSIIRKAGIEIVHARRRAMSATIAVPAEVEFDATRSTRVTPRVGGVVLDVPGKVGANILAGDLLAIIDSPVLGEAKNQYIERAQNLKLAEADLQRIDTIRRGVKQMLEVCTPQSEPDQVRQALAESPIGEAKAKMLRAHATLLLARSEAARQATLMQKKLNSEREYQAARSAQAAAEAGFVAAREEIAFTAERDRLTALRAVAVARGALESSERRLHILGLDERQVGMIGTEPHERLSRLGLKSPVAGRIVQRSVAAGESVNPSDVLFVVVDTSAMWLMADMAERDLLQMHLGLPVHFMIDGMPGVSFEGKVTWISSQVNDRTRTVRLRADLPNPDGVLRAKMFGRARIVVHDNEDVVSVPIEAVQTDGCCQLVFVQESETVFRARKVILGARANGYVEVLKGLDTGETVASTGSFLMKTEILKRNIGAGCCDVDPGR